MHAGPLREALPIDDYLSRIAALVDAHRAVVVTASPGAGKTTRVPPALLHRGPLLLLQPRRVAARAIAHRIAEEQGWTPGRDIGWHVRFDLRASPETRLLVATEGILTARLQRDPLLSAFATVVVDEFHERSIHADLGLALARQAWLARDDMRLVVMSATLDASAVAAFLGGCPVVDVPGRLFPVDIHYRPGASVEDIVTLEAPAVDGATLVFLPGARDIARASGELGRRLPGTRVVPLHGSLDAADQDAAIRSSTGPRVILATNIAETTLTVPDVRLVVDAGWQKVIRYDAERGIDHLVTERISLDAADQRAGRAGRVAPGRAFRLWDAHQRLLPHRQPEIARIDLAGPVLDVAAWGANPRTFEWFEAPSPAALEMAIELLQRLGALDARLRVTTTGTRLHAIPVHPRLGRLLIEAGGAPAAVRAAAWLSERRAFVPASTSTSSDLFAAAESDLPPYVDRIARDLRAALQRAGVQGLRDRIDDDTFRRAVLAAYPDRVGRRRAPGSDRVVLASGTGARLGRESGVVAHEYLVAIDMAAPSDQRGAGAEAVIRSASAVEREWLETTASEIVHEFDPGAGIVRARRIERHGAIELRSVDIDVDAAARATLMIEALLERGPREEDRRLMARLSAAGAAVDFETIVREAGGDLVRIDDFRLADHLPHRARQVLERDVPAELTLPSGRRAKLDYRDDGRVVAAVKLQELFGLAETPRVGPARTPVTFELLAPNGRAVQVTSDLRSFWSGGYQEVRRELRARYPRHPWPEDPWTAQPTHRTVKRR